MLCRLPHAADSLFEFAMLLDQLPIVSSGLARRVGLMSENGH
jgi:hypothetical protein